MSFSFFLFSVLSPQVFAGNLAYSTTDEGLKTFFAPVQSDMYVASHAQHSLAYQR